MEGGDLGKQQKKGRRNVEFGALNEINMISFRADQRCRVQRVNNNKKVCKEACCGRGIIHNNEKRAGKCRVKCMMEMSWVYSRFVGCWLLLVVQNFWIIFFAFFVCL